MAASSREERRDRLRHQPGLPAAVPGRRFRARRRPDLSPLRGVLSTGSVLHDAPVRLGADDTSSTCRCSRSPAAPTSSAASSSATPTCRSTAARAQCRSLGLDVAGGRRRRRAAARSASWSAAIRSLRGRWAFRRRRRHALPRRLLRARIPGVWTHGDLIEFTADGTARLHGRSDGVLNIRGIRVGPAEIYRVLAGYPTRFARRWRWSSARRRARRQPHGPARRAAGGRASTRSLRCVSARRRPPRAPPPMSRR